MTKLGDMVRFTSRGLKKKDLAEEANRGPAYAKEHAGELIEAIQRMVEEVPGLTGKEINAKLNKLGMANAYPVLARYSKRNYIKRRHMDGYWRYFANNYKFSDEIRNENVTADDSSSMVPPAGGLVGSIGGDKIEQQRAAAYHMMEVSGQAQKEVLELLSETPGLTQTEIQKALGKQTTLYRYHKQGKIRREMDDRGHYHYYLPKKGSRKMQTRPVDSNGNIFGMPRALEILATEPGLTQKQLQEKAGVGLDLAKAMSKGELQRTKRSGEPFTYYLPTQDMTKYNAPVEAKPEEVVAMQGADEHLTPEQLEEAKALVLNEVAIWLDERQTKFDAHQYRWRLNGAIAEDIEKLAMQYFWETKDGDLRNFVKWVKKTKNAVVDTAVVDTLEDLDEALNF